MTESDEAAQTNPITLAIMQHALASAADQMALNLYRTANSTIVRDCLDFSTSHCDDQGQMIAQGVTLPHHVASVPFAMRALLNKFDEDIEPGDVFILNDPFDGGMHIPDIFVVRPVFWEDRRVAFAVSTAHQAEIPNTAGMFKPLRVIAPEGTVANASMPAASSMRGITGFRLSDTVRGALAGLLPERVFAAGESVYHRLAGGGGWGDPLTRDPTAVARYVKNDKVSPDQARQAYGVVLRPSGSGGYRGPARPDAERGEQRI